MDTLPLAHFIGLALECSIYVEPTAPGLTPDELIRAGARLSFGRGEINDALAAQPFLRRLGGSRVEPVETFIPDDFSGPLDPDARNPEAFEFVNVAFRDLLKHEGQARAHLPREALVALGVEKGLTTHDIEVAIAIYLATGWLVTTPEGRLRLAPNRERHVLPLQQIKGHPAAVHHVVPKRPRFNEVLEAVRAVISARPNGDHQGGTAMPNMKPEPAASLRAAISRIAEVKGLGRGSSQFEGWKRDTRVAIERVLGQSHAAEFTSIRFAPTGITPRGDPRWDQAFEQDLERARVLLESMAKELDGETTRSVAVAPTAGAAAVDDSASRSATSSAVKATATKSAKPRVFIGSSRESLSVAKAVHSVLRHQAECTTWYRGVFEPSSTAVDDLIQQAQRSDYAILVVTPDDMTSTRGQLKPVPRDNIIFEIGLFMGRLGRRRTFMLRPAGVDVDLPSDLLGVTPGEYDAGRSDDELDSAVVPFCHDIEKVFKKNPPRPD